MRPPLLVALASLSVLLGSARAFAQQCEIDPDDPVVEQQALDISPLHGGGVADVPPPALTLAFTIAPVPTPAPQLPRLIRPRGPSRFTGAAVAMTALYASTAVMQGLDVHSTLKGLDRGATEMNPLMKDLVKHRGLFIATKALVGVSTIMAAREVGKKNKLAAALTLVAINAAYGYVVNNNYRVARQMR